MGLASWVVSGAVAFVSARIVPYLRGRGWLGELAMAVVAALLFGAAATAMDFGGWREPDWRAGVFAFLGALAAVAVLRLMRATRT